MKQGRHAGFSLLEALVVVAIGMVVTLVAVPNMVTAISNMRLRSSMTSLAGVLQNCRMLAVKQNRHMTTHYLPNAYGIVAYVKAATDTTTLGVTDSQVELEAPVTKMTSTPSGPNAPAAISTSVLGFTPEYGEPSFNPTGLPCVFSSGTCENHGFTYYFHDNRPQGQVGWSAISISPAGRLKKWYWNGSSWID
jgi:Tfp pilus assembly protein FimT